MVRRRWVPRLGAESLWGRFHRRFRHMIRRSGRTADVDLGCLEVLGEGFVVALAILAVALVVVFIAVPLVVAVVDVAIVLLLAAFGLVARVVLRRPWTIEARADDGSHLSWRVVGWRRAGEHVATVSQLLAAGVVPPDAVLHRGPRDAQA